MAAAVQEADPTVLEHVGRGFTRPVTMPNKRCPANQLRVRAEARTHMFCSGRSGFVYNYVVAKLRPGLRPGPAGQRQAAHDLALL